MSHQARKRFGQNFLHDERIIHAIVSSIAPMQEDHLVEIGPGQGAITRHLLAQCGHLDAVELDRDLVELLHKKFSNAQNLKIHSADALRFDFASLTQGKPLRIVGNLPYNISTPLMFHLFEQSESLRDMHFMLQKEVVDRLCAQPGSRDYGRLSVMAQYYCDMEALFDVPPESFTPVPKVVSAVIRLIPHSLRPIAVDPADLGKVVMAAFSQRRKTLRNALGNLLSGEEIESAQINPTARAETLSLADFGRLTTAFKAKASV